MRRLNKSLQNGAYVILKQNSSFIDENKLNYKLNQDKQDYEMNQDKVLPNAHRHVRRICAHTQIYKQTRPSVCCVVVYYIKRCRARKAQRQADASQADEWKL